MRSQGLICGVWGLGFLWGFVGLSLPVCSGCFRVFMRDLGVVRAYTEVLKP